MNLIILAGMLISLRTIWTNGTLPSIKSTYPYTKLYNELYKNAAKRCPGYLCDSSGLTANVKRQILSAHNNIREGFAKSHGISNVYKLNWDEPFFTRHSQIKAAMCLPDTNLTILIDEDIIRYWFPPGSEILSKPQAVEVVIASRQLKKAHTSPQTLQESLISYYVPLVNSELFLLRTHTATTMGCGYLVRETGSDYEDHFVCTYGMLFMEPQDRAAPTRGTGCSQCFQYANLYLKNSSTYSASWSCDTIYPHLCTDNKDFQAPIEDSIVTCDSSSKRFSGFFYILSAIIIVLTCGTITAIVYFIYKQQ